MRSGEGRNLPDFLIVGAQKCGTSALRRNLLAHPGITMPEGELHFFDNPKRWELGIDWYCQHFPHTDVLQGEKTPDYLSNARAARRIAEILPSTRIIVLIREPVSRAYSHWNHMMQRIEDSSRRGWEEVSFEEAIARGARGDQPFRRLIEKGEYLDQILRFSRHFPPEQMFIGIQERFLSHGTRELARVLRFLGVEALSIEPEKRHVRSYDSPINPDTRQQLREYYAPFNRRLFEYLGEEIPEWSAS